MNFVASAKAISFVLLIGIGLVIGRETRDRVFTRIEEGKDPVGHLLSDMHSEPEGQVVFGPASSAFWPRKRQKLSLANLLGWDLS
jgi:hypothetical protein